MKTADWTELRLGIGSDADGKRDTYERGLVREFTAVIRDGEKRESEPG